MHVNPLCIHMCILCLGYCVVSVDGFCYVYCICAYAYIYISFLSVILSRIEWCIDHLLCKDVCMFFYMTFDEKGSYCTHPRVLQLGRKV